MIVTPRIVWPTEGIGDKWIGVIHKAGLAWTYEVDDDVYSPAIVARQSRLFDSERLKGIGQLEWERLERIRLLEQADGVSVSTQRLKTIITGRVDVDTPVMVIPNSIDARWFRETLRGCSRVVPPLTIGWAGGSRGDDDFRPLAKAWATIAQMYPHVRFVVQGHIPDVLYASVPEERRHTLPWLSLPEYPRALLNIDIGCCIVAPNLFNTAKSCIKWYEYTLAGASCVVSKTLYANEVEDGVSALVADTAEDWVTQLSRLIESAELRRELQRNARREVMEHHSLEANWWRWPAAWSDILNGFWSTPRLVVA
jgi:glycosyltransferase involved in cell wall biosynthesis